MKNLTLLSIGLITLISCKKDWSCSCSGNVTTVTSTPGTQQQTTVVPQNYSEVLKDLNHNGAVSACNSIEELFVSSHGAINASPYHQATSTVTCDVTPL